MSKKKAPHSIADILKPDGPEVEEIYKEQSPLDRLKQFDDGLGCDVIDLDDDEDEDDFDDEDSGEDDESQDGDDSDDSSDDSEDAGANEEGEFSGRKKTKGTPGRPKTKLTEEMRQQVIELFKKNPSLNYITPIVFKNPTLDGRSFQGRLVKRFLVENGLAYKTTARAKSRKLELTDEQKAFVRENCQTMKAMDMAKVLFPNEKITTPLSRPVVVILNYIRYNNLKARSIQDGEGPITSYTPPRNIKEALARINRYAIQELVEENLSSQNKRNAESLIRFLQAPRYQQIVNSYINREDRVLVESEFIRYVWNKPDLTSEELTLYMNVCVDILMGKRLVRHIEKLNQVFDEAVEETGSEEVQGQLTIRLSEAIKAKTDEYHKIQQRIEKGINTLNGKRSDRIKNDRERNSSFLAIVEAMQEERERKRILIMSRLNREKAKDEAERLESMEEFKARIFGVSKEDAI